MMLDSCTVTTCIQSWGRMDYVWALIDIKVDRALRDTMVILVRGLVEMDLHCILLRWNMSGIHCDCGTCLVIDHEDILCPERVIIELKRQVGTSHDRFQTRQRKAFRGSFASDQEAKVDRNHPKK
ncbi:zinc knuckle CX2CX4HX4C [Artemisia annua]|uniref:Zinc knuckle CX2CX4HX4C n=1 Tax=Artemisia annua TaxID=35608 RepID=A0A2U1M287_ARTAN|nr:zinc knuckle CX2CX4HX4C [Artemisia annua]